MRVLVIGSGAREHALVTRLVADGGLDRVLCAPGNPGISRLAPTFPITLATPADIEAVLTLVDREGVDFTIVGPEVPLSWGIADRFAAAGHLLFGPTQAAARLESSKAF